MTQQIFAAEINFEDVPLQIREKFKETEKNVKRLLQAFRQKVGEVYILATRQRFSIYIVHHEIRPLTEFFHTAHKLKGYVQYYYDSGESLTHLMATASGLLSAVKGESGVLKEVEQAYQWAQEHGSLGMTLDNAVTRTIETAKAVRTQTGIDKFCASVVETGIELLYTRLEDLHKKTFLIVGTGKMARLALKYLTHEGITRIGLFGHDQSRCAQLAAAYGVRAFPMESIGDYFLQAEVVIGVAHEDLKIPLTDGKKTHTKEETEEKKRFILDLGIPPNFDMHAVEPYAAELYHLDDLRRMHASPLEAFGGLEAAWRMVMKASQEFVHVLRLLDYSPVLSAYLTRQFTLKNGDPLNVKPKRSLRSILTFRKTESVMGTAPAPEYFNARAHTNNHVANDGTDVVRHVTTIAKITFYLCDN